MDSRGPGHGQAAGETAVGSGAVAAGLYAGGAEATPEDRNEELARARRLAERYGMELVDLGQVLPVLVSDLHGALC